MRALFPLLACVFLAACVNTLKPSLESPRQGQFETWEMKGRIGVQLDKDGGSASFIWKKVLDSQTIELFGPLGSGRMMLTQSARGASLLDNKTTTHGTDLQALLYQQSGWLIPIGALQYWITGQPQPGIEISKAEYTGLQMNGFSQSGWQVGYDRFKEFSGRLLPSKLTLNATQAYLEQLSSRQGKQITGVRVKLIVKSFAGK